MIRFVEGIPLGLEAHNLIEMFGHIFEGDLGDREHATIFPIAKHRHIQFTPFDVLFDERGRAQIVTAIGFGGTDGPQGKPVARRFEYDPLTGKVSRRSMPAAAISAGSGAWGQPSAPPRSSTGSTAESTWPSYLEERWKRC